MKHALKPLVFTALGTLLLVAMHTHVREHQVPHPNTTKVSLTKRVLVLPQLTVALAAIAITDAQHLIAIELVATPCSVAVHATKQHSCRLRSPPCDKLTPRA